MIHVQNWGKRPIVRGKPAVSSLLVTASFREGKLNQWELLGPCYSFPNLKYTLFALPSLPSRCFYMPPPSQQKTSKQARKLLRCFFGKGATFLSKS